MAFKNDPRRKSGKTEGTNAEPPRRSGDLSYVLPVEDILDAGLRISLAANDAQRAAIARKDGLVALESLEADLDAKKQGGGGVNVSGSLRARVVQTCVVSLVDFETEICADIDVDFAQAPDVAKALGAATRESDVGREAFEARDPPDPIIDGRINLGALVEEFLILNLDPYPRKLGASFGEKGFFGDPLERESPFAALTKLKRDS